MKVKTTSGEYIWKIGNTVNRPISTDCYIGIDQSKTGTGVAIISTKGQIILLETLSAEEWQETLEYRMELKSFLIEQFKYLNIKAILMEQTILPKSTLSKNDKGNYSYASSANRNVIAILNEVAGTVKEIIRTVYPDLPESRMEVNNGTWKKTVLGAEFNKAGTKGSIEYYKYMFGSTILVDDNMTDALCIACYAGAIKFSSLYINSSKVMYSWCSPQPAFKTVIEDFKPSSLGVIQYLTEEINLVIEHSASVRIGEAYLNVMKSK